MFFEEKRDFIDDKYVYWVCYVWKWKRILVLLWLIVVGLFYFVGVIVIEFFL